jgi:hypothetical protein
MTHSTELAVSQAVPPNCMHSLADSAEVRALYQTIDQPHTTR